MNKDSYNLNIDEMARAGVHLGHKVSAVNPKIKPYIVGVRNAVNVFDLEKTAEKLTDALEFIKKIISENKILVFVGTKIQAKDIIKETALACGLPYINERWLGGTFTNFGTVKKRMEYFKTVAQKKETGEFDKYTKKEKAGIEKELKRMEIKFGGIRSLEKLPDAIFVCDIKKEYTAIAEARKKGVPIVAITDTNTDPTLVDYPIPANDDALSSIKYILEKIKEVIVKTKAQNPKKENDNN